MFSQHSNAINTKIIQMCLGLRPFTMCIALAMALPTNISVSMQIFVTLVTFQCVWVIFDLQMCISNDYGLFASKTSIWQFCLQNHFTRCIGHILAFKPASGHRPCPIACTAFKGVPIITHFTIFCYQNILFKSVTKLSF